jgi:hypothetical protein
MAPASFGVSGPAAPLTCAGGGLNVNAWGLYGDFSLIELGRGATLKGVERAMCAFAKSHPYLSAAFEIRAEKLSSLYYGWRFAINPELHFPSYCNA